MIKLTNKSFLIQSTYLRLLTTPGLPKEQDYSAAVELIQDGYAAGKYHTTSSGGQHTPNPIDAFFSFAPTVKGRLFAAELADAAHKATWKARATRWAERSLFALAGAALAIATAVGSDATKQVLGFCTQT